MGKFGGFQSVKLTKPQKSKFDMTHEKRMSVRAGDLVPIFCAECVPSDHFSGSSEVLARLAPLLAPIYEQITIYVHYFFVPNRILWDEWELFITGGVQGPGIDVPPIPPYWDIGAVDTADPFAWNMHGLHDYLGVPILSTLTGGGPMTAYNGIAIDAMPSLAYTWIWDNYYRDQNFDTTSLTDYPVTSGNLSSQWVNYGNIRQRLYRKDYFMSALPFTQRGDEVLLPVDVRVDRIRLSATNVPPGGPFPGQVEFDNLGDLIESNLASNVYLEGSNAASTINDFRSAYALQVWMERNAVGGSRYTESTQAHFGVRPQDSRLQRPEYIGGGRINVKISEVVTTANSYDDNDDIVPVANLAGHGVSYGNTNHFNYFCTEHGFIMGILSIMVPPSYHQGLPRMFRRRSFLDYPWPTFAKLGEQQVDKSELYASPANLTEDSEGQLPLFGYQSRYADWKYLPNTNHGDFHDSLLFWTGTLQFATSPELGLEFLTPADTTLNRWFAVSPTTGNYNYWLYVNNKCFVSRPLPYFGQPNTLGFS